MPWRPHGKARVNASNPQAFAVCDRCGSLHNRVDLRYQNIRQGNAIQPTKLAVCRPCYDNVRPPANPIPQSDGQPVLNARPEPQRVPLPDGAN